MTPPNVYAKEATRNPHDHLWYFYCMRCNQTYPQGGEYGTGFKTKIEALRRHAEHLINGHRQAAHNLPSALREAMQQAPRDPMGRLFGA